MNKSAKRRPLTVCAWIFTIGALLFMPWKPDSQAQTPAVSNDLLALLLFLAARNLEQLLNDGPGHATLRWDRSLDASNGDAEGCNSDRFKCVFSTIANPSGEAALDIETGLVWQRAPAEFDGVPGINSADRVSPNLAKVLCANRSIGDKMGWRMASVHELGSLLDRSNTSPALPAGHPFIDIQNSIYNSATVEEFALPAFKIAWGYNFTNGIVTRGDYSIEQYHWCVRGGGPISAIDDRPLVRTGVG